MTAEPSRAVPVRRLTPNSYRAGERILAVEMPIALSFLGIGYAVMMATPLDLEDFAVGFAASERIIDSAEQVTDIWIAEEPRGLLLNIEIVQGREQILLERVRHRTGDSSCGLCGIENLDQALRPLPPVPRPTADISPAALFESLEVVRAHQSLNRATGAVHAAALFDASGQVLAAREDVGRHNAFDKLIGYCLGAGVDRSSGFVLLTSRCSYELVEKAAVGGVPLLVTVSAPTSLAVERAQEAGLTLIALARRDEMLVVSDPYSLFS